MSYALYITWRALEEYAQIQSLQMTYDRLVSNNLCGHPELTKQFPDRISLAVHAVEVLTRSVEQSLDFDGSKAFDSYATGELRNTLLLAPFYVAHECLDNSDIHAATQQYVDTWIALAKVSYTSQKKAQTALMQLFGECLLAPYISSFNTNERT